MSSEASAATATPAQARVVLAHGTAALELVPGTGGAIANFTVAGRPVLRPTPPDAIEVGDVRRHACYPLVPYSNRIERARLAFAGRTHALDRNFGEHPHSIHGVGWQRAWALLEREAAVALLGYEHRPAPGATGPDANARAWPWAFQATQWFALADRGAEGVHLRMRLTLVNTGAEPFPFGLGWHPFFPRDADTVLGFGADGVWETDPTTIPIRHVAAEGRYRFDPPRPIGDAALDNVYTGWAGSATLLDPKSGFTTVMRGDSASPYFVCYIPRGGAHLALEPVTQMTDAFNRAERGERDTGARILAPGEAFSSSMEIVAGARP